MHLRKTTVFEVLNELVACNDKLLAVCKGQPEAEDLCASVSYQAEQLSLLCQGQQERIRGLEWRLGLREYTADEAARLKGN
jgi:hypothetical protein